MYKTKMELADSLFTISHSLHLAKDIDCKSTRTLFA